MVRKTAPTPAENKATGSSPTHPASAARPASGALAKPVNLTVAAAFVFLVLVMAVILLAYYGISLPVNGESSGGQSMCTHGDMKPCTVGSCQGTAVCINGIWGSCRWEKVCAPGSRLPCTHDLCLYAIKECNSCGTGYGPCTFPE